MGHARALDSKSGCSDILASPKHLHLCHIPAPRKGALLPPAQACWHTTHPLSAVATTASPPVRPAPAALPCPAVLQCVCVRGTIHSWRPHHRIDRLLCAPCPAAVWQSLSASRDALLEQQFVQILYVILLAVAQYLLYLTFNFAVLRCEAPADLVPGEF